MPFHTSFWIGQTLLRNQAFFDTTEEMYKNIKSSCASLLQLYISRELNMREWCTTRRQHALKDFLCTSFLQLTLNASPSASDRSAYPIHAIAFILSLTLFVFSNESHTSWHALVTFVCQDALAAGVIERIAVTGSYQTGQGWRGMGVLFGRR